jgi:hypothetical protein
MIVCRVMGHRWRFRADGATMHWACDRGCGAAGSKRYPSAADAARYAAGLERRDTDALGRRPLLSLLPLALSRRGRRGRSSRGR